MYDIVYQKKKKNSGVVQIYFRHYIVGNAFHLNN